MRPSVRRAWAPIGKTPIVNYQFNWNRISAIGFIGYKADGQAIDLHRQVQRTEVNGDSAVHFLNGLLGEFTGPIFVIGNGISAHRSMKVKEFVAEHPRLTIIRLPVYTPTCAQSCRVRVGGHEEQKFG